MPSYSRYDVVLVRYPFSDFSGGKVRPAIVVSVDHPSEDVIIVALTSRTERLLPGEFRLSQWREAGLNVPTAVKRGVYTVRGSLHTRTLAAFSPTIVKRLKDRSGNGLDFDIADYPNTQTSTISAGRSSFPQYCLPVTAQYTGNSGSTSRAQRLMPPSRLSSFL